MTFLTWIIFLLLGRATEAGRVLFLPSTLDPVHPQTMAVLADELSRRGHQVSWLEIGPQQSKTVLLKNVTREFWPAQLGDQRLNEIYLHRNHTNYGKLWNAKFTWANEQTTGWLASIKICNSLLSRNQQKFDDLVKKRFETVVVDDLYNPCGLLLVALRKSVYVYWSMTSMRTESAWANQSPTPPSYLPVPGTGFTDDLNFFERTINVASYLRQLYVHQHLIQRRIDALFQKFYPGAPSAFEVERNASINFVNNPPIFDFARPFMPRVNFVGGLHCKKAAPLPKDLEDFIKKGNKFVLLTTGFTAQWTVAPPAIKEAYIKTFQSLPSLQFIWQYNGEELREKPANLLVRPWLPQQDLLGHPKCAAHVSHGGLNSVIESVWHGVPVVGLPLTSRGYDNLLRVTARNAGVMVEKEDFNREGITSAITKVVKDPKFQEEMEIFQDMVTDVPFTELYHAAFWVEFIERHQEVPHARSGADKLNVLQYFLVDVIAFFACIILLTLQILFFAVRGLFRVLSSVFKLAIGQKSTRPMTPGKKRN
ncbi:unnamed protein product [Caenorhabditis auriculariae]|uniref:glucuronosyltransferase n=1 Tax=Caenorhabditis auriculariae TaxID=2777116 RepID=A0A8S1HJ91_9PELO|nr:unnamed protein product [Caenorhabditis auriculariae]